MAVPASPTQAFETAQFLVPIVPSDTVDLAMPTRGIYVGVGGDLSVDLIDGTTAVPIKAIAGAVLPFSVVRVRLTGTTATSLLALY